MLKITLSVTHIGGHILKEYSELSIGHSDLEFQVRTDGRSLLTFSGKYCVCEIQQRGRNFVAVDTEHIGTSMGSIGLLAV